MNPLRLLLVAALAVTLNACSSTGVDMPSGSSKGYSSARLIARKPDSADITASEAKVHRMIQNSIASQFRSNGMGYNSPSSDLIVAYLVVYQDSAMGMTTFHEQYFGYGRDPLAISDAAHRKNIIDGKRPEAFERAGVIVDVLDARTNELVYRNFGAGDINRSNSDSVRSAKVNQAVNTALAGFFN